MKKKMQYPGGRTAKHLNHFKHEATFFENRGILEKYIGFLYENGIKPYVVILPYTREYLKYIPQKAKEIMFRVLDEIPYPVDFADMNELGIFDSDDFADMDHLNKDGAAKATRIINELIKGNF